MIYRVQGKKYEVSGLLLILPLLALYGLVIFYPMGNLIRTSFFAWNGIKQVEPIFVGFDNYIGFFRDPATPTAFKNILVLVLAGLLGTLPIGFFLATVINKTFFGLRLFKTCYFLPVVINSIATCLMFTFILFPRIGPFSIVMRTLGLDTLTNVLGNPKAAIYAVAFVNMWCFTGFQMIVFSSGMAAIPQSIYEAAQIDGVTSWQKLIYVTIPMMRSTIKVVMVFVVTGAFKVFDIVMALTAGGPSGATEVLNTLVYKNAFTYSRFGMADAIAIVMLIICMGVGVGIDRLFKRND